jgi:PKD repeat protein/subtilisin family serine protease
MAKFDKSSTGGGNGDGCLAIPGVTLDSGLLEDRTTRFGGMNRFLKTTAAAIGLALLMAGPASAASIESPPGAAPSGPPGAAVANAHADLDGDRIEDALAARIAASQAGDRFDVIVMFEGPDAVGRGRAAAGPFEVTREFSVINGFQAQLTGPQISGLSRAPGLFRISGNGEVTAHDIPSNDDMGATDARFDFGFDGSGVTICVIDTGIDIPHELFATKGMDSTRFFDAIGPVTNPPPYDDNGHGSHVSGIAAGNGTTSLAVEAIGVAPGASLKVAKVLDGNGGGDNASVLAGIDWCANEPDVDILSMSLGGGPTDGTDPMSVAVNCVADPNFTTKINGTSLCGGFNDPKIIVVSAGNSGAMWSTIGAPGVAEFAFTVGSIAEWGGDVLTNWQDDGLYLNIFSSRGPVLDGSPEGRIKPDIVGPGSNVLSAYVFDQNTANEYGIASGTSMSAPFVTGVIALMLQADANLGIVDPLDPEGRLPHVKVRAILTSTAKDLGAPGPDNEYGYGVIDAYAAVAMADPSVSSYVPTAYPGYTRLDGLNVANSGNWFWPFTVTADMLVNPVTPIAGTVTVDGTFAQTCALYDPINPTECLFWNQGVWTPDLELILEEELPTGDWSQVAEGSGEVTLSECPARPVNLCGGVGRAEVVHFIPQDEGSYRFRVFPADDASNQGVGGNFDFEVSMGAPVPVGNAAPVAGFSVTTSEGEGNLTAGFFDTSSDSNGTIDFWSWDFGDGQTSSLQNPSNTYAIADTYTVTLTVTDNDGDTGTHSQSVTVPKPPNVLPTANFTVSTSDLTATFTDTSTDVDGTVTGWSWNFGDGSTSTLENPSHTYDPGVLVTTTYNVTLTVLDDDGDSSSVTQPVTVTDPPPNEPPVASFTVDNDPCGSIFWPNRCLFTDTSSDPEFGIVSWSWDFGDGNPPTVVTTPSGGPFHSLLVEYQAGVPSPVTITLTVTDDEGATNSKDMILELSNPLPLPVSVHIADLEDMSVSAPRNRWDAVVKVWVRDNNGTPVSDATVEGDWGSGTSGFDSCLTNPEGWCEASKTNLKANASPITFSVTSISASPGWDNVESTIALALPVAPAPNQPPVAAFSIDTVPCEWFLVAYQCTFTDISTDSDGTVMSRFWDFQNGITSEQSTANSSYTAAGDYPFTLTVTDDDGAVDTVNGSVHVGPSTPTPPTAAFSVNCTEFDCTFSDGSSDDGPITWSWNFGDGTSSSAAQNPTHTYTAAGTWTVTLEVTDDEGATDTASQAVTVPVTLAPLTLTATGYKVKGKQKADLTWSGAGSADVDIYRDGNLLETVSDSGSYTDHIDLKGGGSYIYQVCEAGSTTCSGLIPVVF